jgi:transposase
MKFTHVIGIDVSSNKLDLFDVVSGKAQVLENTYEAVCRFANGLSDPESTLVVCEATGNYEHYLVDALHEANRIDARMIALSGQQVELNLTEPRSASEKKLISLVRRRSQLLQLLSQENNRLSQCFDKQMCKLLKKSIQFLQKQQKSDGKRLVRGGRSHVRKVLYMATLVGAQCNPIIRPYYLRLVKKGKPKKLALVACMRKLLTILNDMVRNEQMWRNQDSGEKGSGGTVAKLGPSLPACSMHR